MARTSLVHRTDLRQEAFAAMTAFFGAVSLACAAAPSWHVLGAWAGATALLLGAVAQLVSTTTAQRWVTVFGWGAAMVGTMLNVAHGGFG